MNKNIFFTKFSDLSGKRYDPNTYHNERLNALSKIENSNVPLKKLKYITQFNKDIVTTNDDYLPYIGLTNIESNTGLYTKGNEKETFSSAVLFKKGQVLFPKLRPYLNKVYFAEFDGICSTEFHIFDSHIVNNKYLSIFLRSNLVVSQTKHLMSGNTLPRLQTEDIENLLIPINKREIQKKVVDKIEYAYKIKEAKEMEAKEKLDSIDKYLLSELEISVPSNKKENLQDRIFVRKFSVISGARLDPKLYDNVTEEIINTIKKTNFNKVKLKELVIHSATGDWGKEDKEELVDYERCLVVRATEFDNLYNLNLHNSRVKYRLISSDKLNKIDIQENDLLIEKSGGSPNQPVGRVSILTKDILESHQICYSNFIHKIRVDPLKVNANYLFCFLKTVHNIKLTESMQSQTNGIRNLIMSNYLDQVIPLPPLNIQNKIAKHIQELRDEAKSLKDEAMQIYENAKLEVEDIILGNIND